jgi:hypothetical protein
VGEKAIEDHEIASPHRYWVGVEAIDVRPEAAPAIWLALLPFFEGVDELRNAM